MNLESQYEHFLSKFEFENIFCKMVPLSSALNGLKYMIIWIMIRHHEGTRTSVSFRITFPKPHHNHSRSFDQHQCFYFVNPGISNTPNLCVAIMYYRHVSSRGCWYKFYVVSGKLHQAMMTSKANFTYTLNTRLIWYVVLLIKAIIWYPYVRSHFQRPSIP